MRYVTSTETCPTNLTEPGYSPRRLRHRGPDANAHAVPDPDARADAHPDADASLRGEGAAAAFFDSHAGLQPLFCFHRVRHRRLAAGRDLHFELDVVGADAFVLVGLFEDRPLVVGEGLDAFADEGFGGDGAAVR